MDILKNAHFNFRLFITTLDKDRTQWKILAIIAFRLYFLLPSRQAGEKKYF
jgi:hypothetical protein